MEREPCKGHTDGQSGGTDHGDDGRRLNAYLLDGDENHEDLQTDLHGGQQKGLYHQVHFGPFKHFFANLYDVIGKFKPDDKDQQTNHTVAQKFHEKDTGAAKVFIYQR